MIGKLLKTVFVPKEARDKIDARQKARPGRAGTAAPAAPKNRDDLLKDAMSIYRKQTRDVYEQLDEDTRRQIEEDAAKTFGDALKSKN